jgi:phospholipid/cholesterol/gamma-HCH transport system substrate-binding protein
MRTPLLVGLVLIVAAVTLTWAITSTTKDRFDEDTTYPLYADFVDASGIRWKTRVQINGIDVGKIESIHHERVEGRLMARVELLLLDEYEVYTNAKLRKAAESLLGDFRLDLDPGGPVDWCTEEPCRAGFRCVDGRICVKPCADKSECPAGMECTDGSCRYMKLEEGGVIPFVQSRADLEEIQAQLKEVAQNVNEVTESISHVLAGPAGEGSLKSIMDRVERSMQAIEEATTALSGTLTRNDEAIDEIIRDVNQFSRAMAHATSDDGDIQRIAEHLANVAERLDKLVANVNSMVGGDGVGAGQDGSMRDTLDNLNTSISHLAGVTRKIDEGQGTLGRVINDPAIADKAEQTLDDVNQLLGGVSRMETQIELRTQYEVPVNPEADNAEVASAIKNTLALRLFPKPDKYYIIEAIADPRGKSTRLVKTTSTDNNADGTIESTVTQEETTISFEDLKFSAQFAKRYYFITLRFGIIESTGGLGLDLHGLEDKLELRVDAFDFNRRVLDELGASQRLPRLRTTAMVEFVKHLHVQGGVDDFFNAELFTWFVGGVLRFTDEDLKALLTVAPTP